MEAQLEEKDAEIYRLQALLDASASTSASNARPYWQTPRPHNSFKLIRHGIGFTRQQLNDVREQLNPHMAHSGRSAVSHFPRNGQQHGRATHVTLVNWYNNLPRCDNTGTPIETLQWYVGASNSPVRLNAASRFDPNTKEVWQKYASTPIPIFWNERRGLGDLSQCYYIGHYRSVNFIQFHPPIADFTSDRPSNKGKEYLRQAMVELLFVEYNETFEHELERAVEKRAVEKRAVEKRAVEDVQEEDVQEEEELESESAHDSLVVVKQEPPSKRQNFVFDVGTVFDRRFRGYGIWTGEVTAYEQGKYSVVYSKLGEDDDEDKHSAEELEAYLKKNGSNVRYSTTSSSSSSSSSPSSCSSFSSSSSSSSSASPPSTASSFSRRKRGQDTSSTSASSNKRIKIEREGEMKEEVGEMKEEVGGGMQQKDEHVVKYIRFEDIIRGCHFKSDGRANGGGASHVRRRIRENSSKQLKFMNKFQPDGKGSSWLIPRQELLNVAFFRMGKGGDEDGNGTTSSFLPEQLEPEQLELWDQLTIAFIEPCLLQPYSNEKTEEMLVKHYAAIYNTFSLAHDE